MQDHREHRRYVNDCVTYYDTYRLYLPSKRYSVFYTQLTNLVLDIYVYIVAPSITFHQGNTSVNKKFQFIYTSQDTSCK